MTSIQLKSFSDEIRKIASVKDVAKSLVKKAPTTAIPQLKNVKGFGMKAPTVPSISVR